jgi:MinD superfamily P-loop ATPase
VIYAIASGKGGTGKTTVTACLATLWDRPVTAVDLDVEEPNLHLFLTPEIRTEAPAFLEIPVVDPALCSLCGQCAAFCQFKALAVMGKSLVVFPEMCHGCGGCIALCPKSALNAGSRELGHVLQGSAGGIGFLAGRLRVGEAMSPPLMRQVKARLVQDGSAGAHGADVLIDAPPGVSCPAVNAVMDADCIVLVTEPTPFGLHDFRLAVEAFQPLGKPMGAVINRTGIGDSGVRAFCRAQDVPIWAEIPYSRAVAEAYSRGEVVVKAQQGLADTFRLLMAHMRSAAAQGRRSENQAA